MSSPKRCIILVGPPGSGKSTYATKNLLNEGYWQVSQDMLGKKGHMDFFQQMLDKGANVVVDRMNFSKEQRARYISLARKAGYEVHIWVFQVPFQVCLDRCNAREMHPTIRDPETARKALHFFFTKYERPTSDEADLVTFFGHEGLEYERPDCIIVDLDGTLCNTDHRQKYMEEKPRKNWKAFYDGIANDPINEWCETLIDAMQWKYPDNERAKIVLCSGRPDDHRKVTEEWLDKHAVGFNQLFMRSRGDFRKDCIVKEIILDFEILPRYKVLFAVDDRKQVVSMWRRRGIVCLQCAEGDF